MREPWHQNVRLGRVKDIVTALAAICLPEGMQKTDRQSSRVPCASRGSEGHVGNHIPDSACTVCIRKDKGMGT